MAPNHKVMFVKWVCNVTLLLSGGQCRGCMQGVFNDHLLLHQPVAFYCVASRVQHWALLRYIQTEPVGEGLRAWQSCSPVRVCVRNLREHLLSLSQSLTTQGIVTFNVNTESLSEHSLKSILLPIQVPYVINVSHKWDTILTSCTRRGWTVIITQALWLYIITHACEQQSSAMKTEWNIQLVINVPMYTHTHTHIYLHVHRVKVIYLSTCDLMTCWVDTNTIASLFFAFTSTYFTIIWTEKDERETQTRSDDEMSEGGAHP